MPGVSAASEIKRIVSGLERDNPDLSMTARVKAAWNMICDESVKPHVMAVFVVPNTQAREVIVYVDTQIWTQELSMQSELLRLQLNLKLHEMAQDSVLSGEPHPYFDFRQAEQIRKLRFVVSKEKYMSSSQRVDGYEQIDNEEEKLRSIEPVGLDDEEMAQLQNAVLSIEDETLRKVAYRAAVANLSWHKGLKQSQAS